MFHTTIKLKKAILLSNVFITALIFWMLATIVYTWASNLGGKPAVLPPNPSAGSPPAAAVIARDLSEFQVIVNNDMFDTLKDTSNIASLNRDGGNAGATSMNLKLKGTIVGDNNNSYAIIFDGSTGREDLYEINSTIQGARIQEILTDRVVLNISGRKEALLLPVEKDGGTSQSYRPPSENLPQPRSPRRNIRPGRTVRTPVRPNPNNADE